MMATYHQGYKRDDDYLDATTTEYRSTVVLMLRLIP